MKIIASEYQVKSEWGSSAAVTQNKECTKDRAVTIGVTSSQLSNFSNNQLVTLDAIIRHSAVPSDFTNQDSGYHLPITYPNLNNTEWMYNEYIILRESRSSDDVDDTYDIIINDKVSQITDNVGIYILITDVNNNIHEHLFKYNINSSTWSEINPNPIMHFNLYFCPINSQGNDINTGYSQSLLYNDYIYGNCLLIIKSDYLDYSDKFIKIKHINLQTYTVLTTTEIDIEIHFN